MAVKCFLSVREEHVSKRDTVSREWWLFHKEETHDVCIT